MFESPFSLGVEVWTEDPTRNPHREAEIRPAEPSAVESELAGKDLVPKCSDRALSARLSVPRGASDGAIRQGAAKILGDSGRRRPTFTSRPFVGPRSRHLRNLFCTFRISDFEKFDSPKYFR